jgi:hypothetical protein
MLRAFQPEMPVSRDFVITLRKRDIDSALNFQKEWHRAQLEFSIQQTLFGLDPSPGAPDHKKRRKASQREN